MKTKAYVPLSTLLVTLAGSALALTTPTVYNGNGVTDGPTQGAFNGAVGSGSLSLTDDGTTVFGTFTRGTISSGTPLLNNSLTIYIDSVAGGFADTSGFMDTADGNRRSIAGYTSAASHSLLTFASGFLPDYAISLEPYTGSGGGNFGGLWQLANGGANSFPYKGSVNLSPLNNSNAPVYTFSFSLASIGLTPGAGESFSIFGTFVSASGNRSAEAIAGNDVVGPGNGTSLKGFVPFTQTDFGTYTTTYVEVPEPSSLALLGCSGLALAAWRRRK